MSRPFSAARLRASASFVRLTGVSVATFDKMLKQLAGPWEKAQLHKAKSGRPWDVGGLEDHLLIMLIYYRCYITEEFLGSSTTSTKARSAGRSSGSKSSPVR